jgi:uncharacterized protein YkwD
MAGFAVAAAGHEIAGSLLRPRGLSLLAVALLASATTRGDALSAVQVLREGGCGGVLPLAQPLLHNRSLDGLARDWAAGQSLTSAAGRRGYAPGTAAGVHVRGPDSALLEHLRRADCRTVAEPQLREAGLYRSGEDHWLVLISYRGLPAAPSPRSALPEYSQPSARVRLQPSTSRTADSAVPAVQAARALELVNAARTRGTRCGVRSFAPAPSLRLSGTLDGVALGHAADMALHNYFEHADLSGRSPADRVRAVGYAEKVVGENIAYGPQSVEEAVQGWLDSPDHCENIMDPRFAEMGIAVAAGQTSRHRLYWVQLFAAPRA